MAFLQNGTWVPDQPLNATPSAQQPMARQMVPQMNQMPQPNAQPQMQPQAQMQMQNFMPQQLQAAQQGGILPDGPPDPGKVTMMNHVQMMNQPGMQQMLNPGVMAMLGSSGPMVQQGSTANYVGPSQGQQQPPGGNWTPNQYQPMMPQQQAPQHSVMQSVNNASPQSVQNFLSALHQSPQASQTNAWQNPMGVQGQGPQAGFQGFQQNGSNAPPQNQWQGYTQGAQPQLGSYGNQARQGAAPQAVQHGMQNNVTTGGTGGAVAGGGVQQQPTYQQPSAGSMSNTYNSNLKATIDNGLSSASDINSKQEIQAGDGELQDFLNHLGVYSYEYKDPKYGEGRRISPMAQEIEKSPLGAAAISTNSEGYKIVDYGKLMGTQLAALALLNHKYNALESQLKEAIMSKIKEKGKK